MRSMRAGFTAVAVLLLSMPLLLPAQSAQLVIENPEFDFGKVRVSRVLRHTFLLRNSGTSILYIRDMTAT